VVSIYDLFLSRVSEGRDLTIEQVDAVARGRVWTGEQAAGKGLIDEIGGLGSRCVARG
jgi:protease-4